MADAPPQGRRRFSTIQSSLIGVLALLTALFLLPTTIDVHDSYQGLVSSRRMAGLLQVGIDLFQAVRSFGYERGRTNVVLNHGGPLEEMAANRRFVLKHRQEGEQALGRALNGLEETRLAGVEATLEALAASRAKVEEFRQRADADMLRVKEQRDLGLPKLWFQAMSGMVANIRHLLDALCRELSSFDGPTTVIAQLMQSSISMRDECAQEMSLLSGVMLSGGPISQEMRLLILHKRGISDQLWRDMLQGGGALEAPRLKELIANFQRLYYDIYLPLGNEVLKAAQTGGPYALTQKEFLDTGVAAIEALVEIMGAIVDAGTARVDLVRTRATQRFLFNMSVLVVGVFLIVAVSSMVFNRVVNPLAGLTLAIRRIAKRELGEGVPHRERSDEIGAVARAVDVLKDNTRRMIDDYDALERSKAELEQALAEVGTLSGLLPICANCKRIRDDQGYWKQVEVYIEAHSEAHFTHGICPECAKELYPELEM